MTPIIDMALYEEDELLNELQAAELVRRCYPDARHSETIRIIISGLDWLIDAINLELNERAIKKAKQEEEQSNG